MTTRLHSGQINFTAFKSVFLRLSSGSQVTLPPSGSTTGAPTAPTFKPSATPSFVPSSMVPSGSPVSKPTVAPSSLAPSAVPSTGGPSFVPSTSHPTIETSSIPTLPTTLPPSATPSALTPILITGWYQYKSSVGLSSATYLPLGLGTIVDGRSILGWINCQCARYSWGNAAHTLVSDVYGYPIIYLVATTSSPTTSAPSTSKPSPVPTFPPSSRPSLSPITSVPSTSQPSQAPSNYVTVAPSTTFIPPITGWYQYQSSIGLSSAVYLPLGLNTMVDGRKILSWINCGCARYSWGNAAHTLVSDIYGYPIIYLVA